MPIFPKKHKIERILTLGGGHSSVITIVLKDITRSLKHRYHYVYVKSNSLCPSLPPILRLTQYPCFRLLIISLQTVMMPESVQDIVMIPVMIQSFVSSVIDYVTIAVSILAGLIHCHKYGK